MVEQLDGPRVPAARGTARHLVVLLHGYGANGDDLIGLADAWREMLPHAVFVAPNAPQTVPGTAFGRQWFPLRAAGFGDAEQMMLDASARVAPAAPTMHAFLDSELMRHNLAPSALGLVGFSQGTMLALHVGVRRPVPVAAVVGYAGIFARSSEPLAPELPPILLSHGDADEVVPVTALFDAAPALGDAGASVRWHIAPGIGHGIDPESLYLGGRFLADHLA